VAGDSGRAAAESLPFDLAANTDTLLVHSGESAAEALAKLDGKMGTGQPASLRARLRAPGPPAKLLEAVGESNADWARLNVVASVAIRAIEQAPARAQHLRIEQHAIEALGHHGLDPSGVDRLLDRLVRMGVLGRDGPRYVLALSREEAAFRTGDVRHLEETLEAILSRVRSRKPGAKVEILSFLARCAKVGDGWPIYPVESRWPFLHAVALLPKRDQRLLLDVIAEDDDLRAFPLIDSALLMLTGAPPHDWVARFAPRLAGATIYTVAAEGWFAAGGLGRVQQYHSAAMKKLAGDHARVASIEPYYDVSPAGKPIDYGALPTPVQNLEKVMSFDVTVDGKSVPAEVYRGTNGHGVEVYLVRDPRRICTKVCYGYGKDGNACWEDFTEFFSRASLELIRRLEVAERVAKRDAYRPPAIIANDGQAAPLVPFFRQMEEHDRSLDGAAVWMVTHTYKNRGMFKDGSGDDLLARWKIPNRLRADFWRVCQADVTSAGVRGADGASAVSAVHRDEVAHIDPSALLLAITNGDNRRASSATFRAILAAQDPAEDPDRPEPEAITAVKREAKRRLGLDPDRMVIAYSGRLVREKAGRERAFTDANIRALVAQGVQVVIYGNAQPNADSQRLKSELEALAAQLAREGHPGRLVFRSEFGLDDQVDLLAATDLQVQDSDRGTGAAEYSEADVSANGGLQMGPPWMEGIIQRQGVLIDRDLDRPGWGNTLVPATASPEAYLDAMQWAAELYTEDRQAFAAYQASSVAISRVLESLLPGAEYLRQMDRILTEVSERSRFQK
jgi:hypothetical protein